MLPKLARMLVTPIPTPVARPAEVIVATAVVLELHVTDELRFWVLPSLYVPTTVNCCVEPLTIVAYCGLVAIERSITGLTVRTVEGLLDPPEDAAIIVPPGEVDVASPAEVMVATVGTEELHVALVVISCAVPSENTPVAMNDCIVPEIIVGFSGLTVMEINEAGLVSVVGV
jgi:hypothetical protein